MDEIPNTPPSLQEYMTNGCSRELAYVFMLLDDLYDPKQYMRELKETKFFELFGVAVHHDYENQGIATKLTRLALDLAKQHSSNLRLACVQCSSIYTQMLFRKEGFRAVNEIVYDDYTNVNGDKVLAGIVKPPQHKSIIGFVKEM